MRIVLSATAVLVCALALPALAHTKSSDVDPTAEKKLFSVVWKDGMSRSLRSNVQYQERRPIDTEPTFGLFPSKQDRNPYDQRARRQFEGSGGFLLFWGSVPLR